MSDSDSSSFSRRHFLRGGALGAAAAATLGFRPPEAHAGADGIYPATSPATNGFDFTKSSGALQPDTVVDSACQFCNCLCRLKVHLKDGRIIDVLGEPEDPVQDGGLCGIAEMTTQLVSEIFQQSVTPNQKQNQYASRKWKNSKSPAQDSGMHHAPAFLGPSRQRSRHGGRSLNNSITASTTASKEANSSSPPPSSLCAEPNCKRPTWKLTANASNSSAKNHSGFFSLRRDGGTWDSVHQVHLG